MIKMRRDLGENPPSLIGQGEILNSVLSLEDRLCKILAGLFDSRQKTYKHSEKLFIMRKLRICRVKEQ